MANNMSHACRRTHAHTLARACEHAHAHTNASTDTRAHADTLAQTPEHMCVCAYPKATCERAQGTRVCMCAHSPQHTHVTLTHRHVHSQAHKSKPCVSVAMQA